MAAANGFALLAFVMIILSLSVISAESGGLNLDRNILNNYKWCVAIRGAATCELQQDLDIICGQVDCSIIKPGGTCFSPNTVESQQQMHLATAIFHEKDVDELGDMKEEGGNKRTLLLRRTTT